MRIKVGMLYDEQVPFGNEVEAVNRAWAERHGYQFVARHAFPDSTLGPYWGRLPFIRDELEGCDWFLWVDADAVVVNPDRGLEPLLPTDKRLAFSSDYNGLCCGVFALRAGDWCRRLIDAWLLLGNVSEHAWRVFDWNFKSEQTTFKALNRLFPAISNQVHTISEDHIQNPRSHYVKDALMVHFWAAWRGPQPVFKALAALKALGYYPPDFFQ